jgi:DNA-binding transcriptional regulator YhcF (GntR family)
MAGWIRLHRSIQEHWVFQDEKKLKWWLTLLLEVNYQDKKVPIGNVLFDCKRGESIRSLRSWAKVFNTTPDTVRHFFKMLQKDNMITIESIGVSTHLRISNYDTYQSDLDTNKTATDTAVDTKSKRTLDTNKKEKKEKKEKIIKDFIPPDLEDVIVFFDEKGYTRESAEKAFNYYHVAQWKDRGGQQVRNWKQKMIGNWFKEEYKINRQNGQARATVVPTMTTNRGE